MTPLALALNSALLHLLWQGVVVALVLWIALAALRKRSAAARYVASCVALGTLALLPVATPCLAYQRRPLAAPVGVVRAGTALATAVFTSPISAPTNWIAFAQVWALPAWAVGVALLSMRLLWGYAKVATLKRTGDAAEPSVLAMVARLSERVGVTRAVCVLISSLADGPSVIGWLRPVVLLPAATLLGLTPDQLEAVLAHELAHIRRYDYLVNLVQMLIETLLFYHPAVWWISGRIREERELCCDDIAVRCCGDPIGYARALTALERIRVLSPGSLSQSVALGAKGGPLMYRIQRLLGAVPQHVPREYGPSRLPGIIAILLAAACLPAGMNRVHAQPQTHAPAAPQVRSQAAPAPAPMPDQPGVKVDLEGAIVTRRAPVLYPKEAQAGSVEGSVYLGVTIDQNGDVTDAWVLSGPQELRKAALQSVLNWHFTKDAAGSTRQVSITFRPPEPNSPIGIPKGPIFGGPRSQSMIEMQNQLTALLYQQSIASTQGAAQLQEKIDSLRAVMGERQRLDSAPPDFVGTFAGQPLGDIRILGVSDFERDQLLSKLPLFIRHPLTEDSIAGALKAVREFDQNATASFSAMGYGEVAFIVRVP